MLLGLKFIRYRCFQLEAATEDLKAMKVKARKAVLEQWEKDAYRAERQKRMDNVQKRCRELYDWVANPDVEKGKSVPKALYRLVTDTLSDIDFGSEKRPLGNLHAISCVPELLSFACKCPALGRQRQRRPPQVERSGLKFFSL